MSKSLINLAFEKLQKSSEPVKFRDLFDECIKDAELELSEEEYKKTLSRFYTQLSVDGRFVCFADNTWDLRAHHKYTYNEVIVDEDETNDDAEERRMEKQEVGNDSVLLNDTADERLDEDEESVDEEEKEEESEEANEEE